MPPSRLIRIFNIPRATDSLIFIDFCKTFGDILAASNSKIESIGYAYIAYYDLRDSVKAFEGLSYLNVSGYETIRVEFVQPIEFERIANYGTFESVYLCNRSQVLVTIDCSPEVINVDHLSKCLAAYGESESLIEFNGPRQSNQAKFICDFFDIRSAANCISLFGRNFKTANATAVLYTDTLPIGSGSIGTVNSSLRSRDTLSSTDSGTNHTSPISTTYLRKPLAPLSILKVEPNPMITSSLTDLSGNIEDNLRHGSLDFPAAVNPDTYDLNELGVVTRADVPKNNVVNLKRIAKGLDTRCTLMLRNIPNKVDQQMLKEYIDVTNKNTYDFLYLRIDFANKCNVGYAFISFISPEHIITFAKARAGTKWNRFNSEKTCDMSYANIYGKECLIEKFRNSSVMDQNPAYRPKVFHSEGDNIGQEQEFPPPNNMNRKLRSLVSVQRIGLFPPQDSRSLHKRRPDKTLAKK
ncbi:hypothetical protein TRVA0_007S00584 [Trichomonascus vanleenenianus]|uniref:uncharacterized protein n=1 Tax=Trichomonascus vanleenenianus TaxID=2268995 RepID=UPI003ECAEFB9